MLTVAETFAAGFIIDIWIYYIVPRFLTIRDREVVDLMVGAAFVKGVI